MRDYDSSVLLRGAQKMMLQATKLYSWQADPNLELQFTNYDNGHFFYDMFLVSSCRGAFISHFEEHGNPLILSDEIGLLGSRR